MFLVLLLLFVVGCGSGGGNSEEVAHNRQPQVFVFPGPQEERLISQEIIDLLNCTGNAESSQTVTRSHTVLYTLELGHQITVLADGRAGIPGIGEVGVGTAFAANYQVGYGRSETVSRSQTVAAAPASHMRHTIQQFEIWETGELLIVAGEINDRLPYSFRRDFSIKAVAPANIGCSGSVSPPSTEPATTSSNSMCPTTISRRLVEEWHQVGETNKAVAQDYINEFDRMRVGGEFMPQDVLPAGVLVITDFSSGESLIYQQYPVRPIVHYRSWGVFETINEYTAIQYGSCMTIVP